MKRLKLNDFWFSVALSFIFLIFFNYTFFKKVIATYPPIGQNVAFLISITLNLFLLLLMMFSCLRFRYILKPLSIGMVLVSSLASYSMNYYGIGIDDITLANIINSHGQEVFELVSPMSIAYFTLLGLIPSLIICRAEVQFSSFRNKLRSISKTILFAGLIIATTMLGLSKFYASFFRGHKILRYYVNPTVWMYAVKKFSDKNFSLRAAEVEKIGQDSQITHHPGSPRKVIIFVVGETVRGDHVSLNGYPRVTFPNLSKEKIISMQRMTSCGTSTSVSIPCMFSHLGRANFDIKKAKFSENLLDFLNHTGKVKILWRDNNSDSKGVALRVEYQNFKDPRLNPICDYECRDIGMLANLEDYIRGETDKDILIVLHQMGNHGPSYFHRYPSDFEVFKPACKNSELQKCTRAEIVNAYDNTLLYTDHFLSKVLALLKKFPEKQTAMIYVSDHGESLGENAIYLHGMPYFIAPKSQKDVATFFWFGGKYSQAKAIEWEDMLAKSKGEYSHDNIFHTVLGLFEVSTSLYNPDLDIFYRDIKKNNNPIYH